MPHNTGSDSARLAELFDRWQHAREAGRPLTAQQLCADCPELLDGLNRRIAALAHDERQLESGARSDVVLADPHAEDTLVPDRTLSEKLTIEQRLEELRFHDAGGLGEVFTAVDRDLHRVVALKFIRRPVAGSEECRERFRLEAEVTGRLDHPGVVPVYAFGQAADGRMVYAMRFIQGDSLDVAIEQLHAEAPTEKQEQVLEFHNLLSRFVAVCKTVAYAHNRGIVHRDLKPKNIMLGRYGETLVIDWGLAVPVGREAQFKQSGEETLMPSSGSGGSDSQGRMVGTPAYMSPEQADATGPITPASDIYSLGATLYKILTGRAPLENSGLEKMRRQIMRGDFPRPSSVSPHVSKPLEAVCMKAMALDPRDRYPTALALAEDLERYLADEPVSAYSEPLTRTWARWARRHRATTQVAASSLIGLVAVISLFAMWLAASATREREAHQQSLQMSAKFAARTVASEIDRRWHILQAEASDPELQAMLVAVDGAPDDRALWQPLQTWIYERFTENGGAEAASTWFINDRRGVQVARAPTGDTIGHVFNYRDYFHGRGHDLPRDEAAGAKPARQVVQSTVYQSTTDGKLKVAFSVPIWNGRGPTADQQPLGMLVMAVDVGKFGILATDLAAGHVAVLVDTRADYLDDEAHYGLVLHHPNLAQHRGRDVLRRLDAESLASLLEGIERHQRGEPGASSVLESYRDPANGSDDARWIAAFEPVRILTRPLPQRETGWVVIVQQRR